jgi:ABC-type multidrug transport system ATPase subunit
LTDVYLSCETGEILGVLGRNGTGKSTLLKIIFGSLSAETKFVKAGDKILNGLGYNRNIIKYLPQDNFLPGHVKIRTLIELFCKHEDSEKLKDHPLLNPLLNKKSRQLSGGELRLLEIFLIIHGESQFCLIDEPFNGIAPVYKEEVKNIIKEQSRNKGFIITDHDYRNILYISTRLIIIHDGGTREIKDMDDLRRWGYIR